jgi:predicted ribosomally synthesized peptide with SipW-like signal peptide
MKSKILLIAISAALVITLAVGGTLMLFTSKSETATNVVTLGDMTVIFKEGAGAITYADGDWTYPKSTEGIELIELGKTRESGKSDPDKYSNYEFSDGAFTGIKFPERLVPNMPISKIPVIEYKGSAEGYLRVKATVKAYESENGNAVNLNTTNDNSITKLNALLKTIFETAVTKEENGTQWQLVAPEPGEDATDLVLYYYRVEDNALAEVVEKEEDNEMVLFYGFKVPNYGTTEGFTLNDFHGFDGYQIKLVLQVEAIQANWNSAATTDVLADKDQWYKIFEALEEIDA